MGFSNAVKKEALFESKRSCCLCHTFCGRDVDVHHIKHQNEGGGDDLQNAVVLCFDCHSESGHYNQKHPKGNKYSPEELKKFRDEWWVWCKDHPYAQPPKIPISLSPNTFSFDSGAYLGIYVLHVQNKTQNIYYQTWIKISFDVQRIEPLERFSFTFIDDRNVHHLRVGSKVIAENKYMTAEDSTGKTVVFLLIEILKPNEIFDVRIEEIKRSFEENPPINLFCDVVSFSETPSKFISNPSGKTGSSITPPEAIRLKTIRIFSDNSE